MLPALNLPTLVSPLCPTLPYTFPSATAMQQHERYHLPLGFVQQYLSIYHFPSPSPSLLPLRSPSPSPSPSHRLFPDLVRSLSHRPACPPHPHHRHWHWHRQVCSIHPSALRDPPSYHHHHPSGLSHPISVVYWPGSCLACTAGSLAAKSLPCGHRHRTERNTHWCLQHSQRWLSPDWSD